MNKGEGISPDKRTDVSRWRRGKRGANLRRMLFVKEFRQKSVNVANAGELTKKHTDPSATITFSECNQCVCCGFEDARLRGLYGLPTNTSR
jgi:hypothetical protein